MVYVSNPVPPLSSLKLNGEIDGKLVSCEPSPINSVAVTEPATFVVPSNSTVNASERINCPGPRYVPFPITKAVFSLLKSVALLVTVEPNKLYRPTTKELLSLAVVL